MAYAPIPQEVLVNQFGEKSINQVVNAHTTVTLSAAQVIALNATPITLVPAVAGRIIVVQNVKIAYNHGSAAFTIGSSKHLMAQYATSAILINQVAETGFIDQTTSKEADLLGGGAGGVGFRGQAVQITSDDTTITVGTGSTLTITTFFQVI